MFTPLLISLLLAGASGASHAPIAIQDRVEFYRIHGATSRQLLDQIHTLGPLDGTKGRRFAAWTRWNVSWHYSYRSDGGSCRVDKSDVSVVTVTVLPEWTDKAHGTTVLRAGWNSYMAALKIHEAGHRTNGMAAANAVQKLMDTAAPTTDCRALGNAIDTAAHAAIARSNQADIDYDAATRHGASQGAVLKEKGSAAH